MILLITLAPGQILAVIDPFECPQNNIIRQEAGITHRFNGVNSNRILPQCILTHGRFHSRDNDRITKSNHLRFGIIQIILIAIH